MATPDAQLATLAATYRSLRATANRLNVVDTPAAYDVTYTAMAEVLAELTRTLYRPLADPTGWRRYTRQDGSLVELFTSGGGFTVAVRNAPNAPEGSPATLECRSHPASTAAERHFRDLVLADNDIA